GPIMQEVPVLGEAKPVPFALSARHGRELNGPVGRSAAEALPMPSAEIDWRRALAAAAAAQGRQHRREAAVTALREQQTDRVEDDALAAMQLQRAAGPVRKAGDRGGTAAGAPRQPLRTRQELKGRLAGPDREMKEGNR